MTPGSRNLEGALDALLAFDVGKVEVVGLLMGEELARGVYDRGLNLVVPSVEEIDDLMSDSGLHRPSGG